MNDSEDEVQKDEKIVNEQPINEQPTNEQPTTPITKFSVILRFWNVPQEIEVKDIIYCEHTITKQIVCHFIDSAGRLWTDVPRSDIIIVRNFPTKEDIENFIRIKFESIKLEKELELHPKKEHHDVSIS